MNSSVSKPKACETDRLQCEDEVTSPDKEEGPGTQAH